MNKVVFSRVWHTIVLHTILSSKKRADYYRKHKIFHSIGQNCTIQDRKVPLYPELISVGNNVHLAAKILLVTHDIVHIALNRCAMDSKDVKFQENIGCIEIGDNVFIGSNSTILYDVKIGSNVIIGAGSLVNKDVPDNSVFAGVPAKRITTFDEFVNKRKKECYPSSFHIKKHVIPPMLREWCWENFKNRHK